MKDPRKRENGYFSEINERYPLNINSFLSKIKDKVIDGI